MSKEFEDKILSDESRKERIYQSICNALVMSYQTDDIGIDDVEVGNDDVPIN